MVNAERAIVTISKDHLSTLPAAEYRGQVRIIDNDALVADAVNELKKWPILGFDTETRPSFKKGQSYNVALIQLATPECCYLFRTKRISYPKEIFELLEDPKILKVGVSIHDDFHQLGKIAPFNPQSFIDLQSMVKDYKIADNSLSRMHGILFGERVSKGQRLSNWEAGELTDAQVAYAALDAYACLKIYTYLKEGRFDPEKSQYLTFLPEPEDDRANESS